MDLRLYGVLRSFTRIRSLSITGGDFVWEVYRGVAVRMSHDCKVVLGLVAVCTGGSLTLFTTVLRKARCQTCVWHGRWHGRWHVVDGMWVCVGG